MIVLNMKNELEAAHDWLGGYTFETVEIRESVDACEDSDSALPLRDTKDAIGEQNVDDIELNESHESACVYLVQRLDQWSWMAFVWPAASLAFYLEALLGAQSML